jgi:hypothetical protein
VGYLRLYLAPVVRTLALAALVVAVGAGAGRAEAAAQQLPIVVVPGLELEDLSGLADRGAIGLLVPANGPTTSGAQARAALTRGELRSAFLDGGVPGGAPRVSFETAAAPPVAGPAIVLGLPTGGEQPNDRRYPIAVLGDGFHGLLTSSATRLPGVVSIVDVAPTALGEEGGLGSKPQADPVARVLALDRLIDAKKDARLVSSLLAGVLIALLAFVFPRAGVLSFGTALVVNLALGVAETATMWIVLLVVAAGIAAAVPIALVLRSASAVGLALAAVLVLYLAAFAVDGAWVAYAPWGPPQNGRFYGVSNLLETMLLVPALAGAALVVRRFGAVAFAAVAALAFVLVAGSRFGADGGGALVLAAGYGVLAALLAGLRGRLLVASLAGAALLAGGLVALDAATGGSSHVTRAIGGGPESLASHFGERLLISWHRATLAPAPAISVFLSLAVLAALVARVLASNAPLERRALPLAFAAAVAVSMIVNDSPNDVAVAGLVGYVVCEAVMLRARCAAASCSRSSSALLWPAAAERGLWRPRPRP